MLKPRGLPNDCFVLCVNIWASADWACNCCVFVQLEQWYCDQIRPVTLLAVEKVMVALAQRDDLHCAREKLQGAILGANTKAEQNAEQKHNQGCLQS